jgi:hypothetical protein
LQTVQQVLEALRIVVLWATVTRRKPQQE